MRRIGMGVVLGLIALGLLGCAGGLAGPQVSTMCIKQWGTLTWPVPCQEGGAKAP